MKRVPFYYHAASVVLTALGVFGLAILIAEVINGL